MNSKEIEIAVARKFDTRANLIVPNISWGLGFNYELDLLIVTPLRYVYEVEIKISIDDLKAEKLKRLTTHHDPRIKRFYFAIPDDLKEQAIPLIDKDAGILVVKRWYYNGSSGLECNILRKPHANNHSTKLNDAEIINLYKLCAMRVWNLKEKEMKRLRKKQNEQG